jgi:hypothetical protein
MPKGRERRLWILGAGCVWLALVCAGTRSLLDYSYAQGEVGRAPRVWPALSRLQQPTSGLVLVMMVHPRCTCTAATLAELQEFLARASGPPTAYVIFHVEGGDRARTTATALWRQAAAIPGVTLIADDGTEAGIFGANTSGETMLYDASGRLRFAGGITGSRGHAGENYGLNALLAATRGAATVVTAAADTAKTNLANPGERSTNTAEAAATARVASAPVFGCPLHDPDAAELQKDRSWKRY